MKVILGIVLFLIIGSFVVFLLPLAISIVVAYFMFSDGNIVGGIIALVVGLICGISCRYCCDTCLFFAVRGLVVYLRTPEKGTVQFR